MPPVWERDEPSLSVRRRGSAIGRHVKTTEDIARQLQKCTGYMLPSSTQPSAAQSSLPLSFGAELGDGVTLSIIGQRSRFLSITQATWSCSEPDKFYGLQHIWYNVMMECLARFSMFRYIFIMLIKYLCKIETSRI